MGGKKKTKWRKLPLEEFTKEIPTTTEKVPPNDVCQTDSNREENNFIPSYNEPSEPAQNYTEQYEFADGVWYPTSCVIYNPAEIGLYSNYVMPPDACYYYYTVPEVPQMQDYVPMPYQEYTSVLPKDTVYLLLPTQSLRPPQPVQNLIPEWQSRRRRRRYEGYADYAVIPEKSSSTKAEEKDHTNVTGQLTNSRTNSANFNSSRKMTSETSKFNDCDSISEQNPRSSKSNNMKDSSKLPTDMNSVKGSMSVNKDREYLKKECIESNEKCKKNWEICGVHSRSTTEIKESQTVTERNPTSSNSKNECLVNYIHEDDKDNKEKTSSDLENDISRLPCNNPVNLSNKSTSLYKTKTPTKKESGQSNKTNNINLLTNEVARDGESFLGTNQETKTKSVSHAPEGNTAINSTIHNKSIIEDIPESNSKSSLPDILSTLNKPSSYQKKQVPDESSVCPTYGIELEKGISPKPKSFLSQTSYLPNLLSSEALHNEMEIELKQLENLHSLKANQAIYKLAYDENVTDQSEADSRSPSPMDPESQVPSSLTSNEILVHEADSDSDAGSEDVELLPHRYESETFLNENKHMYVNKLSLAVELLRTQESLPYDKEFKRVVGENQSNNIVPGVHTGGKVNLGFMEDSHSLSNTFSIKKHSENKSAIISTNINDSLQYQKQHSVNSSNDSAIFSVESENLEEELCETAKEAVATNSETLENTEEIRARYRRLGVQARHYFSPRAALSMNPCCFCIIM